MTDHPRVALFSSEYPPHVMGGLGVHVDSLTASLAAEVSFDLFVPAEGDYPAATRAARIHEVPSTDARTDIEHWLGYCQTAARLAEPCARTADLLHCHDWMTVLAGLRLRQTTGKPLVYNVHLPQDTGLRMALENLGLLAADLVLVNSRAVREELMERRLPVRRCEVVPNGVDLDTFRPAADWPRDGGYVLFVGRLVAQKGVDLLLRAFGALLQRCPGSRLIVVGDGELELYLDRLARFLGFPDRVSFVGWRTGAALVELYQGAQVVVVPSFYEPFGIVALEAMACGRPVIASRVGGLQEIVTDGVEGYLVDVGDHRKLASRLAGVILDPELRARMGTAALRRAADFSWRRVAGETLALYRELAGRPVKPLSAELAGGFKDELLSGVGGAAGGAIEELLAGIEPPAVAAHLQEERP